MSKGLQLLRGDCLETLPRFPANTFTAVVTDPPYGLKFMGKEWDHGIPGKEFWREFLRVCKPGAFLLAFGGTRTFHRLACAIEDAGWELRDTIMWVYGSGFPKSHDISKAIDKAAGAKREVVGRVKTPYKVDGQALEGTSLHGSVRGDFCKQADDDGYRYSEQTAPATPLAQLWDGWGTALKPSFEPILLCRKPLTVVPVDGRLLVETQTLLGGLLCLLLSNAKSAELISKLSPSGSEGASASALMLAAVLHGNESEELLDVMGTYNSRETVSTCLNIASLWSIILGEVSAQKNTFTTETVTGLTTALQTLNCLLSTNIPGEATQAVSRPLGSQSNASGVKSNLNDAKKSKRDTQNAFARVLASLPQSVRGTSAKNVVRRLQAITPSVVSVLSHALRQLTTENDVSVIRPNWEPIVVAMKPIEGTFAANAEKHGVAGLNVDGCRVGIAEGDSCKGGALSANSQKDTVPYGGGGYDGVEKVNTSGRWPANLILSYPEDEYDEAGNLLPNPGKDEVVEGFPETAGGHAGSRKDKVAGWKSQGGETADVPREAIGDSGSAARFFYTAKASKSERTMQGTVENSHPCVKPLKLMEYLVKLVSSPQGSYVLDPFCGSGSTLIACKRLGVEYVGIDKDPKSVLTAIRRLRKVNPCT